MPKSDEKYDLQLQTAKKKTALHHFSAGDAPQNENYRRYQVFFEKTTHESQCAPLQSNPA